MTALLDIWTVYAHPSDYPDAYVARRFEIRRGDYCGTQDVMVEPALATLRERLMERGLVMLTRSPGDDPVIVESWV